MRTNEITLFTMSIISILLHKYGKPYESGFYCSDTSIFKEYHPIMIRMPYLLLFAFIIPFIFIVFIERRFKSNYNSIYLKTKQMYFGYVFTFILCLVIKVYFGRLRPNSIKGMDFQKISDFLT